MSNSALVVFTTPKGYLTPYGEKLSRLTGAAEEPLQVSPVVYLHWHGSPEYIYRFLMELYRRRACHHSPSYTAARFTQVVAEYMDTAYYSGLSLGVYNGPKDIELESLAEILNEHSTSNGLYLIVYEPDHSGKWDVRRFHRDNDNDDVHELDQNSVQHEHQNALLNVTTKFDLNKKTEAQAFGFPPA